MVIDTETLPQLSPVISVFFPVIRTDEASMGDKYGGPVKGGGTILIVEDDPAIRNALARILRDLGYNVFTAEDGADGVELFRKEQKVIDLTILDIVMPVKGGIEALKEIKEIDSDALVYMTSGYVTGISIDDLISKGAAGFINKPVTISDLNVLVSEAISDKKKIYRSDSSGNGESKA